MAKTIDDYKKDFAAAKAKGDKAGMAAANNAANALRQQQGQAAQVADVTKEVYGNNYVGSTANRGTSVTPTTSPGTGGGGTTTSKPDYSSFWNQMTGGTDYSRRPDLAGQVLSQNGVNVWYDENGYARKGQHYDHDLYYGTDMGVAAPSIDRFNNTGVDRGALGGSVYDQYYFSDPELKNADYYRQKAKKGDISWEQANKYVEGIRNKYGYSGGDDGSGYNPLDFKVWNPDAMSPDDLIRAPFQGVKNTGTNYKWDQNISDGDNVVPIPESVMRASAQSAGTQQASSQQAQAQLGNSAAGVGTFTDQQQSIIDRMNANSNAWHSATSQAEKDRLHAENEYLSGLLGGMVSFDPNSGTWNGVAEFPAFSYENAPEYTSQWDQIIKDLTDQILNRDDFEYNYLEDPSYQQYRDAYTREGERAMVDTLGEVAARTGGMASSYATSAANQANNYYMSALADKIPELRQMAYEAYLQNVQGQRDDLSMLLGLESMDYQKFLNDLSQWNTDRNFDYGVWRDQVNDQRYEQETDYNKQLAAAQIMAAVGDFSGYASIWGLTEDQTKLLVDAFAQQQATSQQQAAMELADWYAQYGDFSKLGELGVDTSYLKFMQNLDYMSAYSGGSSGGSGLSGKSSKKSNSQSTGNSVLDTMLSFNDDSKAKQYLLSLDLSQWEFEQYYSMYEEAKKNSNSNDTAISTNPFDIIFGAVGNLLNGGGTGMNQANFNAAMRSIAVQLESGKADSVVDGIDDMWPRLSTSQRNQLNNLLAKYGYEYTE